MQYILPEDLEKDLMKTKLYPPDTSSFEMPHAETDVMQGSFGSIVVQRDEGTLFHLRLSFFEIHHPIDISVLVPEHAAMLTYVLQGASSIALNTDYTDAIENGAYYLLYAPMGVHPVKLEAGGYLIIHIELSQELLDRLAYKHFVMYEVTSSISDKHPVGLLQGPYRINARVKDTLDKLLRCSLEDEERALYQEARVFDLLLLLVEDIKRSEFNKAPGNYKFTTDDLKAIKEAGELKIERIADGITMQKIAREKNLHPKKLQEGFKLVFGENAGKIVNDARIEKARKLLRESDLSIADIAYETGYANDSSFIRAFKREMGITPAAYRKKEPEY